MQFRSFQQFPPAVKNIMILCGIMFFGTFVMEGRGINLYYILGLFYFDSIFFKPWQLFTHLFMHGGIAHLLFNMLALFTFGVLLENILGTKRFLILYFVSALGAVMLDYGVKLWMIHERYEFWLISKSAQVSIMNDLGTYRELANWLFTPMVGASGALYGIMVAFATFFPNSEMMFLFIPFPIKAKYLIPIVLIVDLGLGIGQFRWDPVAHFAHIGGAVFGYFLVRYWNKTRRDTFY